MTKKLHLGCGERFLKGYIHIDINDFPHIDYLSKIDDLSMFQNESVDLIYASHCFEYFDRFEANNVLEEWNRVLKINGTLRLSVPNFESLILIYNKYKNLDNILGPLFGKWQVNNEVTIYHKTVYDLPSLSKILKNNGFGEFKLWDWREVFNNQIEYDDHSQAYFPHMNKDSGIQVSLNLECKKLQV